MDPWHRFRVLVCLAVMLEMLGAGAWARFWWGVPTFPYGYFRSSFLIGDTRRLDPFVELGHAYFDPWPKPDPPPP